MGTAEGDNTTSTEPGAVTSSQDVLQVPTPRKNKIKSPTPGTLRDRSATPVRGRSQTPFAAYVTRRSGTPSLLRSITPFLKREEKEKTPFELGFDLKTQITCNKAVIDKALVMDISESEEEQKPVRYITSDRSVIDRAAVMDISNVEVIYVVEEYEDYEEVGTEVVEAVVEEDKSKKKSSRARKNKTARGSSEKEESISVQPQEAESVPLAEQDAKDVDEIDENVEDMEVEKEEHVKKGKKKGSKKKEKKEKSPKLSLKLEIGGGQKATKKMFEQKPKPPPKKSKLAMELEEKAKAAAKAAEEEERRKRLKAEEEERKRKEAEALAAAEAEAAAAAAAEAEAEEYAEYDGEEAGEWGDEYGEGEYAEGEWGEEETGEPIEEVAEEVPEEIDDKRRGSDSSGDFVRPDPDDEERWMRIAEEEGENFMQEMKNYSIARRSEKERDADWKRRREQARLPRFVCFLTDRTAQVGQNVRLACAVDGPELSVKWFKDGRQVERDTYHRIVNNNNILSLEIISPTAMDSGEYKCLIFNQNDEVSSSCVVTIYEKFKDEPKPPSFRLIREYYHMRAEELTIECHVYGVPRPRVTWWRGVFEVTPSYKFSTIEEAHGISKLIIYKPTNRDAGTYTCKAVNSIGAAETCHTIEIAKNPHYHVPGIFHARDQIQQDKERSAKKVIEEALQSKAESDKRQAEALEYKQTVRKQSVEAVTPIKQKLQFATQLRDRMALEGSTVKFVCTVIGPNPSFCWIKDEKKINYGGNVRNLSGDGKAILELAKVTPQSSGVYKCVAKNDHSEIDTSGNFKVYSAQTDGDEQEPIFSLPLRDVYHATPNELVLDTKVRGNPRPAISWLKYGLPVALDDRIVQMEHFDGLCELIINKPTSRDAGEYACVAENKLGSQKVTHLVVTDSFQGSRRSSILSTIISDSETSAALRAKKEAGDRLSKLKKRKEEENADDTQEKRTRMPDIAPRQQLWFVVDLSNRYVEQGSKVKLQAVIGGPNPSIRWQKNGDWVTYSSRIRNQNRESLAVLEFVEALPEDSGTYTIVVQNDGCKITTSAQLQVYKTAAVDTDAAPVFVKPIKDSYHLHDNELVLETSIRGHPTPEIRWFHEYLELQNDYKYHILQHQDGTCQLFIYNPNKWDSGKFYAKAENRAGKTELCHEVTFAGKESHIAENIHGVFHADKNVMRSKAPVISDSESEVKESEVVENRTDSESNDEDEETEAGGKSGTHFVTEIRDRTVFEGSDVKLACFLKANEETEVCWYKDYFQIYDETWNKRPQYNNGLCRLDITGITVEDKGLYKCCAAEGLSKVLTSCKLKVIADPGTGDIPPSFTRNIGEIYNRKKLQLNVHIEGLPTPLVTWLRNGVEIEPSTKYEQIDQDDGTCDLFIKNPLPEDSGLYVCRAQNREGESEVIHEVTVKPSKKRTSHKTIKTQAGKDVEEQMKRATEHVKRERQKIEEEVEERTHNLRREVPALPDLKKHVYFRNFLLNRTVKEGSDVKWMVTIDGPEPYARWYRNEEPLASTAKCKMACISGIAWLNLLKVTEEDAGKYTLRVKGPENEIECSCTLFVYSTDKDDLSVPTFVIPIKDTYQPQENKIVLECKVSGNTKPHIYWQKDNVLLSLGGEKFTYTASEEGIVRLVIGNPTKEDSGLYTCYAESDSGQTKVSKFVDVTDYVQKITQKHMVQKILAVDNTASTCRSSQEELLSQKSTSKDNWLKLSIEKSMKPLTIRAGSKVQLICQVNGFIEEVYWLRGNERVTKGSRHKIYNINNVISLEIYDCRPDDTAEYKCVIRNSKSAVESLCPLTVYEADDGAKVLPSNFAEPITEFYDTNRNAIILSCRVRGRPLHVTWLRDDHSISNNRYQVFEERQGVWKLLIRNPIPADCGTFSCFAETEDRIDAISKVIKTVDLKRLITEKSEAYNDVSYSPQMPPHISPENVVIDELRHKEVHHKVRGSFGDTSQKRPFFSSLLYDRTIVEGTNACLNCSVTGDGNTTIEWLKDHRPLPLDNRYQMHCRNGIATLEITSATVEDSGNYTCRASNEYGETATHAQLLIYKHYEDSSYPSVFTQSIRDNYSLHENELVLDCRVRGKPRPQIQWMKGTDYIENSTKYRQVDLADGYSKLVVSNPTENDSGIYTCIASNEAGKNRITHLVDFGGRERFTLEKSHGFFHRDINKPHFLSQLGNQTVTSGGTIAISAEFMVTDAPIDVHWYRNRQLLNGRSGVKTFMDKGVYTMAILNATAEDEGTYTCRASTEFGQSESHATVDVAVGAPNENHPPLFLSRPDTEMKIAFRDPFSISFRVAGEPKPKLTLMKGTRDITNSDRVTKEVSDDYIRFTVQRSQISDCGTYFVVARNAYGTDRIFVSVTVAPRTRSETPTTPRWGQPLESFPDTSYFRDPPGPISTEPLVVDSGPTHLSLSWGKPVSDNSAPVIAYRVDAWLKGHEGGAMWKELGLSPINSFDAFKLKPNCEYHFRVTPKNRYGWGPSVQTSVPVQIGGAECLPEFVQILPGQLKALLDSELVLECAVRGAPRPQVTWYKDGIHLTKTSDRIKLKQSGSTFALVIAEVSEADAGRYTCEAANSRGRVSTFARVQVVADSKVYAADTKLKEIVNSQGMARSGDSLPIFTMRLRDRRVQVTYPVRLTCQVIGYPTPEVLWYKDGEAVVPSRRHQISEDGQFHTLELTNTVLADGGVYTCTAKNELGSVSCHGTLIVDKGIRAYITPDFYMPLDPLYIFEEGKDIRLTAKVEAYPSVGVSWYRNGVKLRPSRRISVSLDCSGFVELTIAEAAKSDAGIYMCVALNAVGRAESICRVSIEDVEEPKDKQLKVPSIRTSDMPYSKEPLFVVKPRSSEAYEGDTVIIFCEVVGDPKPEVIWLRDFLNPEYYKDAPHFRRIGDGPEYRLEIPSAKLDFTGTYSIIASNCYGEAKAVISLQIYAKDILGKTSMEKGSIRQGNVETLPRFMRHLKDLRCCDGDAITLECHVEAVPEPIIIWEKDGHVLHSSNDLTMSYDGIKATLSIQRVYPEDEGEYTCVAKNSVGRTLSSACIIVDLPEENENMLSRQLNRPLDLLSANSTPFSTPRSTPNRGFSPLPMSYRNSSIDVDGRKSCQRSTSGRLPAVAAPKFLAIPHNRVVEEGESVRFQCAISGHPSPWSTWDKEGIIIMPTTRISIKEVNDLRFLEIEEVTFEDAGLYRITLENDYGRIEATARLDVIASSRYSKSPSARRIRASSSRRNAYLHRRIMGYSTAIGGRMALAAGCRGKSVPSCNADKIEGNETAQILRPLPPNIETVESETVDLQFRLRCSSPYTCIWKRNGEIVDDSEDMSYIDHGNGEICLRIYDAFEIDSGHYTCEVITDSGHSCNTSSHLTVVSRDESYSTDQSNLRILKSPLPIIATSNSSEVVFCARVYPLEAISTWVVCGHVITDAFAATCTLESSLADGVRVLRIHNLKEFGDSIVQQPDYCGGYGGEVQLIVSHPGKHVPSVRAYTSLVVWPQGVPTDLTGSQLEGESLRKTQENSKLHHCPPLILESPNQCTTAFIGDSVSLTVVYQAEPEPEIRWLKAGRPIIEGGNITITGSTNLSTLHISDISADDSGKYSVEVMNELGEDAAVASVSVEGPPDPPSGKPCISQGPDRIAIAWCGPPYDGGCMLNGFIIEMQEVGEGNTENDSTWHEIARVVDSLAYAVKNLNPNLTYRFRVRAENIHGRSAPSLPSDQVQMGSDTMREEKQSDFQGSVVVKGGGDFKSRFTIIEELGKGRFGVVYKVLQKESPHLVLAAKIIKCIKASDRQKVQEEVSIMKSLQHPKLLQLAASFEGPREIVMVMEYITGGELFERVVADDFTLTERDCTLFVRQICEGVAYMHSQSIVHLDLKPENIMCHTRTSHQIKIIDFGLAQRLIGDSPVRVLFGTPEFIPPEVISYEPIGFQSDMWSVGVICYVLLSGLSPFMGDSDVETFANITRADYDYDDDAFDCVSYEAKDFISHLLVHRKEDRWTAERCLESKWLTKAYDEQQSNARICTDKLKKFIIRRKWQKTGNAIRALGRMATLSASRRNSATSSVHNSPRPSLSGITLLSPNTALQMGSVNEEDDDFTETTSVLQPKRVYQRTLRIRDKSQCTERSDSGYSECSNCSGTLPCHCQQAEKDVSNNLKGTDMTDMPFSIFVPHELLKSKLEKIAGDVGPSKTDEMYLDSQLKNMKIAFDDGGAKNYESNVQQSSDLENPVFANGAEKQHLQLCVTQSKDPIMHSDFTNTVKMRKKSLEKSVTRENFKPKQPKIFLQSPGKVSRLRGKFDKNVSTKIAAETKLMNFVGPEALSYVPAKLSAGNNKMHGISPRPPITAASAPKARLSGRVQESTERLSKQHTISSSVRRAIPHTSSPNLNDSANLTSALLTKKKAANNQQK